MNDSNQEGLIVDLVITGPILIILGSLVGMDGMCAVKVGTRYLPSPSINL